MDVASPPKRMTRARAAAKAGGDKDATAPSTSASAAKLKTKTTKATTKSTKTATKATTTPNLPKATAAKASATTATTTTTRAETLSSPRSGKRKLRPFDFKEPKGKQNEKDDLAQEDGTMNRPAKKPRGRAKKADGPTATMPEAVAESEPEPLSEPEATSISEEDKSDSRTTKTRATATKPAAAKATTARTATSSTRATRGRAKKATDPEETPAVLKKQTPATISRTRTRKTASKADDTAAAAKKPAKKTARGATTEGTITTTYSTEPTPGLKSAVSRVASKADGAFKKTVTFREPEKENVAPEDASKSTDNTGGASATGMRAKPVRKPAVSGRTTRASARAATTEPTEKKPLSPKKDVQNRALSRDPGSDDELATYEKTPLRPLMKSPVKPTGTGRKIELPRPEKEKDENSPQPPESPFASVLASPARRPASTPFKDALKSPAKRVDAVASLLFSSTSAEAERAQSPAKTTMLQSPAKRSQISFPTLPRSDEAGPRSPTKMSLLNSPAKRPMSPIKFPGPSAPSTEVAVEEELAEEEPTEEEPAEEEPVEEEPAEMKQDVPTLAEEMNDDEELQLQIAAEIDMSTPQPPSPASSIESEQHDSVIEETVGEDELQFESPIQTQLAFPGRLSAVLPRHADPALNPNRPPMPQLGVDPSEAAGPVQKNEEITMSAAEETKEPVDTPSTLVVDSVEATTVTHQVDSVEVTTVTHQVDSPENPAHEDSPTPTATESSSKSPVLSESESESESKAELKQVWEGKSDGDITEQNDQEAELQSVAISKDTSPESPSPQPAAVSVKETDDTQMSDSEDELASSHKCANKFQTESSNNVAALATPSRPLLSGPITKLPDHLLRVASRAIQSARRPGTRYTSFTNRRVTMTKPVSRAIFPAKVQEKAVVEPVAKNEPTEPIKAEDISAATPTEDSDDEFSLLDEKDFPVVQSSPSKGFFDDEMKIRADMENQAAMEALLEADIAAKFDKYDFHDLGLNGDGSPRAADGLSFLNMPQVSESPVRDEVSSESSRERGDGNTVPIDPSLLAQEANARSVALAPTTPKRPLATTHFHTTVSKVPLKRGDDSPPRTAKRHCSSASKLSFLRPDDEHRDTAGSDSVTNQSSSIRDSEKMQVVATGREGSGMPPVTPTKPTARSSVGTPARTTRADLDPHLLRGAVVYVDVHTAEGADAGRLFVELLLSMGARCVKSWPWNPSNTDGELDASKVGITHVVFKDGGRRTLEKVVESNGLVQIVQCGWVLDCERYNTWLSEKEYRVDTSLIPRGGHNRRKSMEPTALSNMNGTLITPARIVPGHREPQTLPNNYMSRRDSTLWVRSPSVNDEDEDAPSEHDWASDSGMFTPVPKTPAPETVARFAMDISPATPTTSSFGSLSPEKGAGLTKTCPPKPMGMNRPPGGILNPLEEQNIRLRLMAARRQSMQYAPKNPSPLAKQWRDIK
ncbi:hypothetical protein GGS20DRAFT_147459 [Poronia punctata]|nr:hypothetical protein GGS20DRAFT_147459 [Poronia punctata]